MIRAAWRGLVRSFWRLRIWYARRQVRAALVLIERRMDSAGFSRTHRRQFYRDMVPDRFEYLKSFWS